MTKEEIGMMKQSMFGMIVTCQHSEGCGNCPFLKYCHVMDYETPMPEEWEIEE